MENKISILGQNGISKFQAQVYNQHNGLKGKDHDTIIYYL